MINKITLLFTLITFCTVNAQITFEWETAIDNGDNVSETIDGITATFSGLPDIDIEDCGGCFGSSGNLVVSQGTIDGTSVTFSFSEPVIVNSILAIDGNGTNIDYTFIPSGGDNSNVIVSLNAGSAIATLNWIDVNSFTVNSSGSLFGFDNLLINDDSFSSTDNYVDTIKLFPNPVQDILYLEGINTPTSIKVYNSLGELLISTREEKVDFSGISKGVYFIEISTNKDVQIRKIIKQ
ncbi:T9SS type A sorting domain-containing protein [Altibacter sp. HG106]|uniref:T9SS type A sorting domain-containing protein n=1 Tax=Altibacter sp. HG106 TaxID=3023937 RepID=UPI0023508B43|nr:T9SS type A sorting domain-containing protein [Altibacter sp. HG106]MDC7996343.1 T9SS type A sorting domain-containing protein [Altibacter sp. HG106]